MDSKTHPVAPQSKMPEVFAQLDSKITHMMKAVSAALVKDDRGGSGSGAGDSGAASGGGGAGGGGGGVGGSGGGGGDPSSSKDVVCVGYIRKQTEVGCGAKAHMAAAGRSRRSKQ